MKHSAYRSMILAKENKNKTSNSGLKRWIDEKWRNLTPITLNENKFYECGKKSEKQIQAKLPSVCRPTKRVNTETPVLANNYTKKQIKKAVNLKKQGKRITWSKL